MFLVFIDLDGFKCKEVFKIVVFKLRVEIFFCFCRIGFMNENLIIEILFCYKFNFLSEI